MWETQRLEIANLVAADAPACVRAFADSDVDKFLGVAEPISVDDWLTTIARWTAGAPNGSTDEWLNFSVRLKTPPGLIVGRLQATRHGSWAEVAWVFSRPYWGHGYATEAGQWLVAHLAERGVLEFVASVDPANVASVALLIRLGFHGADDPAHRPDSYDDGDLVFVRT